MKTPDPAMMPMYEEVQRYKQPWLWGIVIFAALLPVVIMALYFFPELGVFPDMHQRTADRDALLWGLIVALVFGALLLWLFSMARLETVIAGDSIYFRYFPFNLKMKRIRVGDISAYEIRRYSPIMQYGGWGIRWGMSHGMAYNVSGNIGLQITTSQGKKIMIGTQRPEDLEKALKKLFEKNSK
ncbi:MAG: hypothetical protein ACOCX7_03420 [Bacteroidota bacterium]